MSHELYEGAMILLKSGMLQIRRVVGLIERHDDESRAGVESTAVLKGLDAMIGSLLSVYGTDFSFDEFDNDNQEAIETEQAFDIAKKLNRKNPVGKVTRH